MKKTLIITLSLFSITIFTGCRDIFGDAEQPGSIVQAPTEPSEIIVTSPTRGSIYEPGEILRINWFANSIQSVDIELYRKSEFQFVISDNLNNTGILDWQIPNDINLSNHYLLKIVNHNNPDSYQFSGRFGIQ
jgi:hypothetical protein